MKKYLLVIVVLELGCNKTNHKQKNNTENDFVTHPKPPRSIITTPEGDFTADLKVTIHL